MLDLHEGILEIFAEAALMARVADKVEARRASDRERARIRMERFKAKPGYKERRRAYEREYKREYRQRPEAKVKKREYFRKYRARRHLVSSNARRIEAACGKSTAHSGAQESQR